MITAHVCISCHYTTLAEQIYLNGKLQHCVKSLVSFAPPSSAPPCILVLLIMFPLLLLSHEDKIMVCVTHHPITNPLFLTWSRAHMLLSDEMASASRILLWLGHWPASLSEVSHSALKVIKHRKDPSILHHPLQLCSTALWTSSAQPMIVSVSIKATVSNMATFNPLIQENKKAWIILTWVLKSNDLRGICVNNTSVVAHANFIAQSWY